MRLTWKRSPANRWDRKPDSARLSVNWVHVGSATPAQQKSPGVWSWMWSTPSNEALGIAHRNTFAEPVEDIDAAKAACEAYVRECLGLAKKKEKQ